MQIDGNAAAIVGHRHRAIAVKGDGDAVAIASQRLVDGIVDHLVDHVMEARPIIGVADIHPRTLAHRIQTAQHLDLIGAIVFGAVLALFKVAHSRPSPCLVSAA